MLERLVGVVSPMEPPMILSLDGGLVGGLLSGTKIQQLSANRIVEARAAVPPAAGWTASK
jgi:hypothetical protein